MITLLHPLQKDVPQDPESRTFYRGVGGGEADALKNGVTGFI